MLIEFIKTQILCYSAAQFTETCFQFSLSWNVYVEQKIAT